MEKKKRLYFLIVPAVCIYIAAITFVIIGSASRNPVEPRKLTKPAISTFAEETAPSSAASEVIVAEDEVAADTEKAESIEIDISVAAETAAIETETAVATATEVAAKPAKDAENISAAPAGLNGMGGADVTPQPEMGIEVPELYYTVYRIKPGDMISTLAEDNHITQDTLISVNNIKQSRTIQIGQYIRIPSMAGIVYTTKTAEETPESIAEKYKVSAAKVAQVNQTELGTVFGAGTTLFVPDAELDWITRQEINGDLFTRPLRRSYYISSRFSWRVNPFTGRRTFHNGIDMAAPQGTPIYAALGGTVVATGWDNVYGKYVTVAHHSGYKTLYGHMSKITTKKGAHVTTSTKLGEVGSTGQSTGPHLHFTVYKNGSPINPANVWN
ncbi:MAG: M23 family metallopeptidase [Spirochaetales bacterium]|nr:M23 family metallopeptidase [Spirochaetales bacterium]